MLGKRTSSWRTRLGLLIALLVVGVACSGQDSPESENGQSRTLTIPLGADIGSPDPDVFYAIEGLQVTTSLYEGLLRYEPGTGSLEPAIAESLSVSDDGLEYTFHIRPGVTFHDGTEVDAEAVRASFQRRIDVAGGPSYMLLDVKEMAVPEPMTFVVRLSQPSSAFPDYVASAYGPKITNQALLAENEGGDLGQTYLTTNDAGTGPYMIADWQVGNRYVLEAFPDYWGGSPSYTEVVFPIVSDPNSRRVQLESGQLDMLLSGVPKQDVDAFQQSNDFTVTSFEGLTKALLFINPNEGPFADPTLREALRAAIDRDTLVEEVFGTTATLADSLFYGNTVPLEVSQEAPPYDPSTLEAEAANLGDRSVDLAFWEAESGAAVSRRAAELIQTQLQAVGLEVEVRGIPTAQVFEMPYDPTLRPDLMFVIGSPDIIHPDAIRTYYYTDAPVNLLGCSVPGADAAMDRGLSATSSDTVVAEYGAAGNLILEGGCILVVADVLDTVIARAGIENIVHDVPVPLSIRLGELTEA